MESANWEKRRSVRVGGWARVILAGVDERLAPAAV
jgi:hypothetical protein